MKFTISKPVEIILDGEKYLLEDGDVVQLDPEYYGKEVENPVVKEKLPKSDKKMRRKKSRSHLEDESEEEHEEYEYSDIGNESEIRKTTNLPKKETD